MVTSCGTIDPAAVAIADTLVAAARLGVETLAVILVIIGSPRQRGPHRPLVCPADSKARLSAAHPNASVAALQDPRRPRPPLRRPPTFPLKGNSKVKASSRSSYRERTHINCSIRQHNGWGLTLYVGPTVFVAPGM